MKDKRATSSLLSKYTLLYERNPRSRVFAPLAEVYRKLGMLDESFKILKEGIKFNPTYTLGYIVLAHGYYDLGNVEMAYSTLRPFVAKNLENITLQKLFGKVCMELGHHEEALQTYKYLLLINNRDEEVAKEVKNLEDNILVTASEPIHDSIDETQEFRADLDFSEEDQWVQVNFESNKKVKVESRDDDIEKWSQQGALDRFKNEIKSESIEIKHHTLDDQFFHEDYDTDSDDVLSIEDKRSEADSKPIITHTLVDLYCSQGHKEKAREILESILEIHPEDQATIKRLAQMSTDTTDEFENYEDDELNTESQGQNELDRKVEDFKSKSQMLLDNIEDKFNTFHKGLVARSNEIKQVRP